MKFYLFFCMWLTLVYGVSTRNIASQINEETSDSTSKEIQYFRISPLNLTLYPENMPRRLKKTNEICKPPLLYWRNTCYEATRQGPCRRGSIVYPSIDENVPKCVKNPCRKDGWAAYSEICQALGKRGSCASNLVPGVEKKSFKIKCIADNTAKFLRLKRQFMLLPPTRLMINRIKRRVSPLSLMFVADAPVKAVTTTPFPPCPSGFQRNKVGECRKKL